MDDDDLPPALPAILPEIDPNISIELKNLFERGLLGDGLPSVMRTSKAAMAFQQAFELIGGVPRLALWADQNPGKFYTLFSKLVPATAQINQQTEIKVKLEFMSAERAQFLQSESGRSSLRASMNPEQPVEDAEVLAKTSIPGLPQ